MKKITPILILVFQFGFIHGIVKWPEQYYVEGEKIDLIEQYNAPFKMWYDTKNSQMRFDTYNGKVKIYVKTTNDSESIFMEHYATDKDAEPTLVCTEHQGADFFVEPLRDLDDFELTGKVICEGKRTHVWTYTYEGNDVKIQENMYVYRNTPVGLNYKSFNTKTGELTLNYIVKYFDFTKKVNKNVFEFDDSNCEDIYDNELTFAKSLELHNSHTAFSRYKKFHSKNYEGTEQDIRKKIFEQNWRLVRQHNTKNLGYFLTLNHFADRTPEEMRRVNSIRSYTPGPGTHQFPHIEAELDEIVKEIPEEFDWRLEGAVSRIKSQRSCGSCWAFAVTAAIEGALSIKYKTNFDLSEQSVVDCAWGYKVYGCDGGYSDRAMHFVQDHGIATEEDYGGYLGIDGECHIKNMTRLYKIDGFVAVTRNSVNALKAAVYLHGPVVVCIWVSSKMSLYSNGIYYEFPDPSRSPDMVNHAVTVVGYGVRDGDLYWIVKNSCGQSWGEDGYILISAKDNTGNVLYAPYYPIV